MIIAMSKPRYCWCSLSIAVPPKTQKAEDPLSKGEGAHYPVFNSTSKQ